MNHREAKGLLAEFAAGDLDSRLRREVARHVQDCLDCRSWLETHDLLATASDVSRFSEHPESNLVAAFAVEGAQDDEPGGREMSRHIETCESCRLEMELVRAAVLEARAKTAAPALASRREHSYGWWYSIAAACVVAIAIKLLFPGGAGRPGHVESPQPDISMAIDSAPDAPHGSPGLEIAEEEIEGTRLLEADGPLTLNRVKIKDGAEVTIRAGQLVAFGNGFQVGPGARVTVDVNSVNLGRQHGGSTSSKDRGG